MRLPRRPTFSGLPPISSWQLASRRRTEMTKRYVLGIFIVAAAIAAGGYALVGPRRQAAPAVTAEVHGHSAAAATTATPTPRGAVELDTRRQQLIGVRTVIVRRASLDDTIRLAGTVVVDETRQSEISTHVDG